MGSLIRRLLTPFMKTAENTLRHLLIRNSKKKKNKQKKKKKKNQEEEPPESSVTAPGLLLLTRDEVIHTKFYQEEWMTRRLSFCMTTGIGSTNRQVKKNTKRNITMAMNRLNDSTYSSYIRRFNTTVKIPDKRVQPRQVRYPSLLTTSIWMDVDSH